MRLRQALHLLLFACFAWAPPTTVGAHVLQAQSSVDSWIAPGAGRGPGSLLDDIVDEANRVAAPGGAVSHAQRAALRQNLPVVQRRGAAANRQARREFGQRQGDLIAEWTENTGQAWPVEAGRLATPHHLIPLESGGANAWWNIVPTFGKLPTHSLPGIPGPHSSGSVLRTTIQQSRKALPAGSVTDLRLPRGK